MNRVLILAPLFTVAFAAATTASTALSITTPDVTDPSLARVTPTLADAFGREPGVHIQRGMRDLVHHTLGRAERWLNEIADTNGIPIPDLTVLRVEPIANETSSGFGWREDPIRKHRKFHNGSDFRGKHGTPVVAAGDGVISFCGPQNGYGNVVYVDHGGGVITRYAHLRRIETKKYAAVTAGQRIGQVGSTGRATGPHLHFEVRLDGRAVDPVTAMTVAQLTRESPSAGRIAAYVLSSEVQSAKVSDQDPPKGHKKPSTSRPERRGHVKRVRPLS
jgi:murein DD-endopeptidase MepM/ murein hydrolase activator NlpD